MTRSDGSVTTLIAFDFGTLHIGVAVGQSYVLARLWIKLTFWASETALFQGRLGHAGYVVRAEPTWPDSPAADAI